MFRAWPWPAVIQRQRAGLQAEAWRSGTRQTVESPDCVLLRRLGFFFLGIMNYHRYKQGNDVIQLLEVLQIYLKLYGRYGKSRKSHIFQCQMLLADP